MPVAVGIYLPLSLSVPILAGGLLNFWLHKKTARAGEAAQETAQHTAVLIASGLIAGEAIAGILIAAPRTLGVELPIPVLDSNLLSLLGLLAVFLWMARAALASASARPGKG
jgi:hypothetical protein